MRIFLLAALFACAAAVPRNTALQTEAPNDMKCSLCEEVVSIAEKELTRNSTETEIKKSIENVCQVIEKYVSVASELCAAVEDNVDQIIRLLESELSPQEVCKLIKFCDNTNPVVEEPVRFDGCDMCQTVIVLVEKEVQKNSTEETIEKLVGSVCTLVEKYIPHAKAECTFVQDNIPTIIGLITSEVSPQEVCTLIGQCSKGQKVTNEAIQPPKVHMPFDNCDTCKEIIQLAEAELQQNATETEIKELVSEACTFIEKYIPDIAAECQLVEDNIGAIIEMLVNRVTPEEACTLVGLCSSKAIPAILKMAKLHHMA